MKTINNTRAITLFLLLLLIGACTERETAPEFNEGETVTVSLQLQVADGQTGMQDLLPAAKATNEGTATTDIRNAWIIQFDKSEHLIGMPQYIANMTTSTNIQLMATTDATVVCLVNTFNPHLLFHSGMSLAKAKQLIYDTPESDRCLGNDGTNHYVMMSGSFKGAIINGTPLTITLQRNVVKLTIKLNNTSDAITIKALQLHRVPASNSYWTYTAGESPLSASATRISYPQQTVVNGTKGYDEDFTFYTPANPAGTVTACPSEKDKPVYAPPGATYLAVYATLAAKGNAIPVKYMFFLGANLKDDYNLLANHSYTYAFTLAGTSVDPSTDARVETQETVDFTLRKEQSNCYMLQPSELPDETRQYIIPIQRINEFWESKEYQENIDQTRLINDNEWKTEILWSDFEIPNGFTVARCTADDNQTAGRRGFLVTVPYGVKGNIIVAVKKNNSNYILWSWHLWITDYNPDKISGDAMTGNAGSFGVPGGEVQRYAGSVWESGGKYAAKYMMDRDIGALQAGYPEYTYGQGCLYYQFGRKDPFPGKVFYPFDVFSTLKTAETGTVQDAVLSPTTYYTHDGAWTSDNWFNPSSFDNSILWQDPLTAKGGSKEGQKSIFDPSPLGWRLPEKQVWEDFTSAAKISKIAANGKYILTYTPEGATAPAAVYSAIGYRNSHGVLPTTQPQTFHRWCATPQDKEKGVHLSVTSTSNTGRTSAMPIRPVKE